MLIPNTEGGYSFLNDYRLKAGRIRDD